MVFFIDDLFLRSLGISIPPFDMIWVMETLRDYAEETRYEENQQNISNKIKENRLLYELGEITKEEYTRRNKELNHQRKTNNRMNGMNINQRINLLDL